MAVVSDTKLEDFVRKVAIKLNTDYRFLRLIQLYVSFPCYCSSVSVVIRQIAVLAALTKAFLSSDRSPSGTILGKPVLHGVPLYALPVFER